jgi:HK97 family phage portal protein
VNVLGLTISRAKTLQPRQKRILSNVDGSRSWWTLIHEITTGGWQRNEEVHVDTVLSNPTLYSCITLIAGDIAKLRPKLVERDSDGIWHEVESPAFSPVLRKPNTYQTRIDFFEWWQLSKLCHGNLYALKERDARGVVRHLHILDPQRVSPLISTDGSVFYQLSPDDLAQINESVVVPAREIIHDVMCPLFHPLVGVSPIYAAGYPAMQGLNIRNASDRFFTNGSRPGGVITAPGMIEQSIADELKAYWETEFSGDNVGKVALLSQGMKYEAMAVTAEQSQLVEQLRMTDEDIAKCFHMPRHKVGIGPDPTYNNIESLNKQYYSDCLQKHIEKLEIKLDEGLELTTVPGRTLGVEMDRSGLFEMDTNAKTDAATKAVASGMTVDEVRARYHDLGPVPGGDQVYLQKQNWPLALLGSDSAPSTPTNEDPPPTTTPTAPDDGAKAFEVAALLFQIIRQKAA